MRDPSAAPPGGPGKGFFPPTRWSVVAAARGADTLERERALDLLVAVYWRPVYRHVRLKWGRSHEEASDLVQDFFAELLSRDLLARYDPARGRLRTYLRVCVDGLVANAAKAEARLKRGGRAVLVSLDLEADRDALERSVLPAAGTPEEVFDREFRRSILALAVERLAVELRGRGRELALRLLEEHDLSPDAEPPSYAALAARHGVAVTDVTNHLALARRELRRLALELLGAASGGAVSQDEARGLVGPRRPRGG